MKLKFIGACRIVTGSCYLFTINGYQFLMECGMFQGRKEVTRRNYEEFPFDPKKIKFLILSHAHIDHSGLIPKLVKQGFTGNIYCTKPTKALCRIMLQDSGYIQEVENRTENRKRARKGLPERQPLYTRVDAVHAMKNFKSYNYDSKIKITPEVSVIFRDAGHILGSAIIELFINENGKKTKIVFSGDLGQSGVPIIRDPTLIKEADYVLIETTYGDRIHEGIGMRRKKLFSIINKTIKKDGKVIIPSFAIERSQELLYYLNGFFEHKLLPRIGVFLDSPLAINATNIFLKFPNYFNKDALILLEKKDNIFNFPGLKFTKTTLESKKLNTYDKPCIIIAGSGMCTGGRIKHHLKNNIWNKKNTVLFIGYQARGTLGRRILEGEEYINIYGEKIKVNADIEKINAFSAHADKNGLIAWLRYFNNPKKVFLVHGELESMTAFKKLVNKQTRFKTSIPVCGDEITI